MFDGCTSLKTITIPETVKEIEDWAFGLCNSLEYIFIPASVEKIEPAPDFPFFGCYNLTLEVSEDNQYYSSANDMLFNKDKTVLVKSFSKTAEVAIPDGVESIEGEAFWGLTSIRQLTFPASVKLIGPTCCVDCMNLKTVICLPTTPPFSSPDVWTNYDNADGSHDLLPCKYFVPAESLDLYNQARGWQNLKGYIYPYNPAGVGSISPEDELLDIYDINGVTIKRNATPDALDALPAGLYIVNGKKVVVR